MNFFKAKAGLKDRLQGHFQAINSFHLPLLKLLVQATQESKWSPIQVQRESSHTFTVENHFNFLNASECTFTLQLRQYPTLSEMGGDFEVLEEQVVDAPSIPPGGKGTLKVPLLQSEERVDAWALKVEDPGGRQLWTWVWPRPKAGDVSKLIRAHATEKANGTETVEGFEIKSGDLAVKISKRTGGLLEVKRDGEAFPLTNGPQLMTTNSILKSIRGEQAGREGRVG